RQVLSVRGKCRLRCVLLHTGEGPDAQSRGWGVGSRLSRSAIFCLYGNGGEKQEENNSGCDRAEPNLAAPLLTSVRPGGNWFPSRRTVRDWHRVGLRRARHAQNAEPFDGHDEAVAAARKRFDKARTLGGIAKCLS